MLITKKKKKKCSKGFSKLTTILIAETVVSAVLGQGGKKTGSGRTRAGNCDKLSDTGPRA